MFKLILIFLNQILSILRDSILFFVLGNGNKILLRFTICFACIFAPYYMINFCILLPSYGHLFILWMILLLRLNMSHIRLERRLKFLLHQCIPIHIGIPGMVYDIVSVVRGA